MNNTYVEPKVSVEDYIKEYLIVIEKEVEKGNIKGIEEVENLMDEYMLATIEHVFNWG